MLCIDRLFLRAISIEINNFLICLELCLIFLRVTFRFHGDEMKFYHFIFYTI